MNNSYSAINRGNLKENMKSKARKRNRIKLELTQKHRKYQRFIFIN